MKKSLLITAALLMGSASYSYANLDNIKSMPFAQMDKNGDSVLSKEEVCGRLFADFDKFDKDANGTLSADELPMQRKGLKGKHHKRATFAELDSDGNGSLSASEFTAQEKGRAGKHHKRPTFAQMDKNEDGALAKEEVRGRLLADFDKFDKDASGTLSADELPAQRQGRKGKHHKRPTFTQMDRNEDGVLTKEEVRGRLLADFDLFDKDASGTLSADELPCASNKEVK